MSLITKLEKAPEPTSYPSIWGFFTILPSISSIVLMNCE